MLCKRLRRESPQKYSEKKPNKNTKKRENCTRRVAGAAVPDNRHGRAATHGRACAVRQQCRFGPFCPGCTAVHPCGTPVRILISAVLLFFMLGASRISNLPWIYSWSPLFHRNPKISPEMKINAIQAQNGSKEDSLTLNHLDLTWNEQEKGIKQEQK